jgi:hypothetical protein
LSPCEQSWKPVRGQTFYTSQSSGIRKPFWGGSFGKDALFLRKLSQLLPRMRVEDRELLLVVAEEMAQKKKNHKKS